MLKLFENQRPHFALLSSLGASCKEKEVIGIARLVALGFST